MGPGFGQLGEEGTGGVAQRPYGVPAGDPVREAGVGEDQGARAVAEDVREVVAGEVLVDRDVVSPARAQARKAIR